MADKLRLLAHAGATTSRASDERYKAQAVAYLAFKNGYRTRINIMSPQHSPSSGGHSVDREGAEVSNIDVGVAKADRTTFVEDSQLAVSALDSQFFGALVPAKAPAVQNDRQDATVQGPKAAGMSSSSQTDSISATNLSNRKALYRSNEDARHGRFQARSPRLQSRIDDNPCAEDFSSQLPSSYSLTESDGPRLQVNDSREIEPEQSLVVITADGDHALTPSLRQVHTSPAQVATEDESPDITTEDAQTYTRIPTTIRPSAPIASISTFTTHVTPALQHLADDSAVSRCFNPVYVARDIDVLERGHWFIDCQAWTKPLQIQFWTILQDVVGSGSAGWGVWCYRGADEISIESIADRPAACDPTFGPVKVYGFGEVARHIYLLLYVASNSKVRRAGLRWIDCEGKVVIQMQ